MGFGSSGGGAVDDNGDDNDDDSGDYKEVEMFTILNPVCKHLLPFSPYFFFF